MGRGTKRVIQTQICVCTYGEDRSKGSKWFSETEYPEEALGTGQRKRVPQRVSL